MQLFLLPFAGANVNSYKQLIHSLEDYFQCIPLELPGRGMRYSEPLLSSVEEMTDDMIGQIVRQRNLDPWIILGHSLGAVLAHQVISHPLLTEDLPEMSILTGRAAPHMASPPAGRHHLERDEFFQDLARMGGIDDEILNNSEILNLLEPVLKSDFKAIERYDTVKQQPIPVTVPLLVFSGDNDVVSAEQAAGWRACTEASCSCYRLEGDHFFIFSQARKIADLIFENLGVSV